MPELPDLSVYLAALRRRIEGERLEGVRLLSPFVLRSVDPPLASAAGRKVVGLERLGKRIVLALEPELFLVLHLMIAGRLRWLAPGARGPGRIALAAFDFEPGALVLTEASKKKRASLRVVAGRAGLAALDPGGVEPLVASDAELRAALTRENRTLKRALTDPRLVAGIGNSYSDEILWTARLSPFARTAELDEEEWMRLLPAVRETLSGWIERLLAETGDRYPDEVTAFRDGMAVHGRFGQPCPRCGGAVQRIVYAENEANYCPECQTGGRLLADRALSRLLHGDWPKTLEELEGRKAEARRSEPGR
ncbi:MAG TPA: DNA-formamidopyrimidine glycosylase family protein [Thermoanaerobaculia bacterium]|nr:DNA-formamidopyrimidine glycosylase family protein [Thermoanaerobaculia bacterium]